MAKVKKKLSAAEKTAKKVNDFFKMDDTDPQGMMKIDTSKIGIQTHSFSDRKGNTVSGEYPYPGFSVQKKYERQQTVEQNPKKYTKGSGTRKPSS